MPKIGTGHGLVRLSRLGERGSGAVCPDVFVLFD